MLGIGTGLMLEKNPKLIEFLVRDEFTDTRAAGAVNGTPATPGPGTRVVADTGGVVTVGGGNLVVAGDAGNAGGDPSLWLDDITHAVGVGFFIKVQGAPGAAGDLYWGLDSNQAGWIGGHPYFQFLTVGRTDARVPGSVRLGAFDVATARIHGVVMRSKGGFMFIEDGSDYLLVWVHFEGVGATVHPAAQSTDTTEDMSVDWIRAAQMGAPWNTDYGIATARLAGARTAGDTFVHEADCLIEFECTTISSVGRIRVHFRIQDSDNYWYVGMTAAGDLRLYEVVAASETNRMNAVGVISGGERIVIRAVDEEIKLYYDDTLAGTYSSAANFKTETDGELNDEATDGSISEIISWPRVLSGAALREIQRYTG